ncbi:MAG TPA: hypothetical protein VJG32_01410 [Anaerolineae bacterium]|nr:hypothetical protein [Anaerolineae bacterium]
MPQLYDLAIAWNWEHDADFVTLLDAACRARALSLLQITPPSLAATLDRLQTGDLVLRALLDRAWDIDEAFYPLADWASANGVRIFNDRPIALRAWDKATMHLEFITAGLHTPYTIVLSPFNEAPTPLPPDLTPLGERFIVKPAHGGGGTGVQRDLATWMQIQHIRQEFPNDKYLVQAWIRVHPTESGPAWFRILFALGEVFPFWWNVQTHVYRPVTAVEEARYGLAPLREVVRTIAHVSRLDIFSTEIAQRVDDRVFVSVDYVNDPIDLRLQSKAIDGVPDAAVRAIADRIAEYTRSGLDKGRRTEAAGIPANLRQW